MKLKNIAPLLILLVLVIIGIFFFQKYPYELKRMSDVSVKYILILAFFVLLTIYLNGLRIKMLTEFYKIKLKKREWFGLSAVTTMANYIMPFRGGASVRAIYLKKAYKFPYTSFTTTMGAWYIVSFFTFGLIGIIVSLAILNFYKIFSLTIFILLISIFVPTALVMLFSPKIKKRKNRLVNSFVIIINEWRIMRKNLKFISKLIMLETIALLVMAVRFYYAFQALDYSIVFLFCLLIALLSQLSTLVSITPANLGIREAVIAFSSRLLGASLVAGAYAATLDRAIAMILVFALGSIFSYVLAKHK